MKSGLQAQKKEEDSNDNFYYEISNITHSNIDNRF